MLKSNQFMVSILETLYTSYPDFFFSYIPVGSLREGFGKLLPSTSVLATDHDIMLVPDGVTISMCYYYVCADSLCYYYVFANSNYFSF